MSRFIVFLLLLVSCKALTDTYHTLVQIDNTSKALSWLELSPLNFAPLVIDSSTLLNAKCKTASSEINDNQLCPGYRGEVTNATFTISGVPNAMVDVVIDTSPQTYNGISFTPILVEGSTVRLDANGNATYQLAGELTLVDLSASGSTSFSYDIEFTTQ